MNDTPSVLERWKTIWLLLAVGLAAPIGLAWPRLPVPGAAVEPPPPPAPRAAADPVETRHWKVLQPAAATGARVEASTARFRLAGTFLSYSFSGEEAKVSERYAILDLLDAKRQKLAHVGDVVEGWTVRTIEEDRATLENNGVLLELTRTFTPLGEAPAPAVVSDADPEKEGVPFWDQPALETNRFGKRIGDNRWVIKREKVMEYYNELLADPERLVNLYKSFYPDRRNGEVEGFRLKFAGEQDFFKAIGIREADVVRSVNSMQMTSQKRAEFFIGEFVRNNIEALVFDVERDGKEEQLIYLIR